MPNRYPLVRASSRLAEHRIDGNKLRAVVARLHKEVHVLDLADGRIRTPYKDGFGIHHVCWLISGRVVAHAQQAARSEVRSRIHRLIEVCARQRDAADTSNARRYKYDTDGSDPSCRYGCTADRASRAWTYEPPGRRARAR